MGSLVNLWALTVIKQPGLVAEFQHLLLSICKQALFVQRSRLRDLHEAARKLLPIMSP
ncbi:unnamed protein product, partial [Vitis vinifera]|uniref:Uncharacterized protein n=1 Tax=Vitis vinifera TaxID=29760 RepID=D7UB97_VITVI